MSTLAKEITIENVSGGPVTRVCYRGSNAPDAERFISELCQELRISPITARILSNRGVNGIEAAKSFIQPTLKDHIPDPFQILNITAAADLILDAIEKQEQITVYTDFDVDGVSSGAQLVMFLEAIGARVNSYTPNRFTEGYGLVSSAIEKLAKAGTQLLVTVDCGINSKHEIALAKRRGMRCLVLDHHHPTELPPADVVVDPAQDGCPFKDHQLAAAGLVWMLLIVLRKVAKARGFTRELPDPKDYLDLAALGTICDMVPLSGVNRVIAHRGVEALEKSGRVGIQALKDICGLTAPKRLTAGHVAFLLGPRMNAAGRLEDAKLVMELLCTNSSVKAKQLASSVDRLNEKRKAVEERIKTECEKLVQQKMAEQAAIAIFGEEYHVGVLGIVAQRLVEKFHRPAAVMGPGTMQAAGEVKPVIKGSIRSVPGFHVAEVLASFSDILLAGGGHAQAGGFTVAIDKLEEFRARFYSAAERLLSAELRQKPVHVDAEAKLSDLTFDLVKELGTLAPFGVANPSPVLASYQLNIEALTPLSSGHVRFRLSDGRHFANAIAWRFQGHPLLRRDQVVNVAYSPEINTFNGVSSVQLNIKEIWR